MRGHQGQHHENEGDDDVEDRRGLKHVEHEGHDVPGGREAHEVVVGGLPLLVGVAEHRRAQDKGHEQSRQRPGAHWQGHVHEDRRDEGPGEVVDDDVDNAAVEPGDDLGDPGAPGQGAVNAVDDEGDEQPDPHPCELPAGVDGGEHGQAGPHQSRHGQDVHCPGGDTGPCRVLRRRHRRPLSVDNTDGGKSMRFTAPAPIPRRCS